MSKPVGPKSNQLIERAVYALWTREPNDSAGPRGATGPGCGSAIAAPTSAPHGFHNPALVALPVAILLIGALVMLLLTLGEADLELGAAALPIQLERHDGVTAPLDRSDHVIELAPVEQEFPCAGRVGFDVGGSRIQRIEVRAEKKGLAVLKVHVGFRDLRLACAHALDLPTHEGDAGLEALLDEVIEAGFAVDGDRRQFFSGGWFHLFSWPSA